MEDRASLAIAFDDIKRVFSVQNWTVSGVEGEIRQGKNVADAARAAQVEHLVFGSAGTGDANTGVPHFDSKLEVEAYMRRSRIPSNVIRPGPFMELMTDKQFFPALGIWGAAPRVLGWHTPKPWTAVRDVGIAIANTFENPQTWTDRDVSLIGDVKSLAECQALLVDVDGKKPLQIPVPLWLFRRLAGDEMVVMWQWLVKWVSEVGREKICEFVEESRQLCPELLDLESWLRTVRKGVAVQ